jgi:hypothetical protein
MTAFVQGLFFWALGLGLLGVAGNGFRTGWLPYGPRRFGVDIVVRRAERPLAFWSLFVGYVAFGLWMAVFGIRLWLGLAAPVPWS